MSLFRWPTGFIERRHQPREAATTPAAEADKAKMRAQVTSLEDEIRTILLELEAGVYARNGYRREGPE